MDLEGLVKEYKSNLAAPAYALKESIEFGLDTACALVIDGTVVPTTLIGLRNHLPCSVALASEAIQRFLLLRSEYGFDSAFEMCSADTEEGEEFVTAWDESQRDLEEGIVMTVNDLVEMIEVARKAWCDTPRRMLVVCRLENAVSYGSVSVDWVLDGR